MTNEWRAKVHRSRIIKFLEGLNDSYLGIRGHILMNKALPSLSEIYNILDQDNSQRSFNTSVSPHSAFQVTNKQPENSATTYYSGPSFSTQKSICTYCGRMGHTIDKCYKKHGYPPGFGPKFKQPPERNSKFNVIGNSNQYNTRQSSKSTDQSEMGNLIGNLSKDQVQQFSAFFNTQLQHQTTINANDSTNMTGTCMDCTSISCSLIGQIDL